MKESYKGERALFLGNGINRTERNNGISWGNLLQEICNRYLIPIDLNNELKPFPLEFEEMLYTKEGGNDVESKLRNLKVCISEIFKEGASRLIDNGIHSGLMQSGIKEIITTNYDYNLEESIISDFMTIKASLAINNQESRNSLYRGYDIYGVKVRHIHGELLHNRKIVTSDRNYPEESIMIGFDHYSDYFTNIQRIIKGEKGKHKDEEKKSLLIRLRDNQAGKCWTDLFFTHEIIFAGFGLDFSENHLWWLLLQREQLKRESNNHNVRLNNRIIFCIPKLPLDEFNYNVADEFEFNKLFKRKLDFQKNKAVADILSSLKIDIKEIDCHSYREFYLRVIEQYSNH